MRNQLKTIVLLGMLSAVFVGLGALIGGQALYLFAGLAAVMNVGAYFFSDRLVLKLHGASEVDEQRAPRLHAMVAELAVAAGIPKPRVAIIPASYANAFATGRNPSRGVVAVTEGLLSSMSERELRGVVAHEIAHIRNRDILVATIAATMAAAVAYLANAVQFAALFGGASQDDEEGGSPMSALAVALFASVGATLVQLGISRSREFLADETAARLTHDAEGLALALERLSAPTAVPAGAPTPAMASLFIVNPLSGLSRLWQLFSTHPPVEQRVARLRALDGRPRSWRLAA